MGGRTSEWYHIIETWMRFQFLKERRHTGYIAEQGSLLQGSDIEW